MEIVIAILLLLILVALVSGNKDAANSVGKTIRIGLFVSLIGLTWLILIGYSIFFYFSYSEMGWSDVIGLAIPVLLPAFYLWANKDSVKALFQKDNKTVFKTLSYFLLGAIAWVGFGIWFQEQKKIDPNIGWVLLGVGLIITGGILVIRATENGWKKAFTFPSSLAEEIERKYVQLRLELLDRRNELEAGWKGGKAELDDLFNDFSKRFRELDKEEEAELHKAFAGKKKEDWVLLAFYWLLAFVVFGLLGQLWDLVYDWVFTLSFVKGRSWVANGAMILALFGVVGLVFGLIDEHNKPK
jgi:hypothetical protein